MQITSVPAVLPVSPADKSVPPQAADQQREAAPPQNKSGPLQPTPALRPTLQDKVEMTRALLELREG